MPLPSIRDFFHASLRHIMRHGPDGRRGPDGPRQGENAEVTRFLRENLSVPMPEPAPPNPEFVLFNADRARIHADETDNVIHNGSIGIGTPVRQTVVTGSGPQFADALLDRGAQAAAAAMTQQSDALAMAAMMGAVAASTGTLRPSEPERIARASGGMLYPILRDGVIGSGLSPVLMSIESGPPSSPYLHGGPGPPTNPGIAGQVYVDFTTNAHYVWSGDAWRLIVDARVAPMALGPPPEPPEPPPPPTEPVRRRIEL
jgi:hypothetical protein